MALSSLQTAFFIDVDNTLLDNDHIKKEIRLALIKVFGKDQAEHFWAHHDGFRDYQKYVDFPKIIRGYCQELHGDKCQREFMDVFSNIEFKHALYPKVVEVLKHLRTLGKVALFTEGDMVYQKRKIEESGLSGLVDRVFLFEQKMDHLAQIISEFSGYIIIFIDDRAEYLDQIKLKYPKIYTVNIAQGHFARDDNEKHQGVDLKLGSSADLLNFNGQNL